MKLVGTILVRRRISRCVVDRVDGYFEEKIVKLLRAFVDALSNATLNALLALIHTDTMLGLTMDKTYREIVEERFLAIGVPPDRAKELADTIVKTIDGSEKTLDTSKKHDL